MSRTIIIPLADPHQDQAGIAEQALNCTRILVPHAARVLLLSVLEDEAQRAERQAYLTALAGTVAGQVTTALVTGDPATAILAVAEQEDEPVIVMASHGRRGAELRRLGSVAASVARGASGPVMIVPASPATEAPVCTLIERVLLPINDIEIVEAFIEAALAELGPERAANIAFHLVEVTAPIPPRPAVTDGERYVDSSEVPAHYLRRAAEIMQERGYRATWDLRIGDPSREIARLAAEQGIDLIVMPAHGNHGFNSLVPGIFAAQVQATAPVPVLLVQPVLGTEQPGASRLRRVPPVR